MTRVSFTSGDFSERSEPDGWRDDDKAERDEVALHSAQLAFERVRAEALRYRQERDNLVAQHEKTVQLEEEIARLRRRVSSLQGSRTMKVASVLKRARKSQRAVARLPLDLYRAVKRTTPAVAPTLKTKQSRSGSSGPQPQNTQAAIVPYEQYRGLDAAITAQREAWARESGVAFARRGASDRLRVAAVVDDFTRQCLRPECDLLDLHPETWEAELSGFDADLLFVESAWRGDGGTWHNTVPKLTPELKAILDHCREHNIPTVFWNKEDPVHFHTFLTTAAEFDHVYTTDVDCVPRYRAALGHHRVHLLPFACQPALHNPVEKARPRRDAMVFAGGYYTRYPERMRDLDALLEGASAVLPVEIFDRNFGTTLDDYRFPERYDEYIVGTLHPSKIDMAYKGYRFALNLNSVKGSHSMFARRAYELLACGTVTMSNYARGLKVMLGDLVPMSDGVDQTREALRALRDNQEAYDRLRLVGLRQVHTEHTYRERLRYLCASIVGDSYSVATPSVLVVAEARTVEEARHLQDTMARQKGVRTECLVIATSGDVAAVLRADGCRVLSRLEAAGATIGDYSSAEHDLVAVMDPQDWYGDTYLIDLVVATRFCDAPVVGKHQHAAYADGELVMPAQQSAYRFCTGLEPRRAGMRTEHGASLSVLGLLDDGPAALEHLEQLSVDRFDYCRGGAGAPSDELVSLRGHADLDTGVHTPDLYRLVDESGNLMEDQPVISREALLALDTGPVIGKRALTGGIAFTSHLPAESHKVVWSPERWHVTDLWPDGVSRMFLDVEGTVGVRPVIRYFDAAGEPAGVPVTLPANVQVADPLPLAAETCQVGLRFAGPGRSIVGSLELAERRMDPLVLPRSKVLLVTNAYPSYDHLYRNGFVHSRVRTYRAEGLNVDVFQFSRTARSAWREFEGVEVRSGSAHDLRELLRRGSYEAVAVHFLSPEMWHALKDVPATVRIVVWVHGYEIQPWWRRAHLHADSAVLEQAKVASSQRLDFWRELIDANLSNMHFVFVSQHFAEQVMEDIDRSLAAERYSVIHNPIDTSLFTYVPKASEQRKRILSIRPYASNTYANDLAVAAVLKLAAEPWFEDLEFLFVGDGPLFESTLEPLRGLANVEVRQGFITQPEIAQLHREYGVFLVPTRHDSQGVSRDEAMASGLVPVTTAVAAVPEFVSPEEGYLGPLDDAEAIVDAIRDLYHHPEVFAAKSAAAAARVRKQAGAALVIPNELDLLRGGHALRDGAGDPRSDAAFDLTVEPSLPEAGLVKQSAVRDGGLSR